MILLFSVILCRSARPHCSSIAGAFSCPRCFLCLAATCWVLAGIVGVSPLAFLRSVLRLVLLVVLLALRGRPLGWFGFCLVVVPGLWGRLFWAACLALLALTALRCALVFPAPFHSIRRLCLVECKFCGA